VDTLTLTRHYCTYFDQRYLPRALALYYSLKQHSDNFCLWALCFDDASYQRMKDLKLQDIRPISHEEFTRNDDQLLAARENRSLVEYYFTCSPSLPLFVLYKDPSIDLITYLDADLYFFSSPEPLFNEIGTASIAIIPHRFPLALRYLEDSGIYNVGWLTFKRDIEGLSCLQRWRNQCLEWCYDRVEGTRFADQGYLNDWPETYQNLTIIQQKGANLAPWNISRFQISMREGHICVDEDSLIFFHFQSLACVRPGIYKLNFSKYKAKPSRFVKANIYAPYIRLIEEITYKEKTTNKLGRLRNPSDGLEIIRAEHGTSIFLWLQNYVKMIKGLVKFDYMFRWNFRK
jgi:hypothetical protein